jgi:hypothetical protein
MISVQVCTSISIVPLQDCELVAQINIENYE